MTVQEASDLLKMNPQSLRVAFQKGALSQFGCAYPNKKGNGFRYLINEQAVIEFTGGNKK